LLEVQNLRSTCAIGVAAMTGARSRNKGKRGELEIVHLLRDNLGIDCNRNYKQVAQAQHGDIEQLVAGYLLEVKNCAKTELKAWWQQTVQAATKRGAVPCLVYKVPRKGWRFRVPLPQAWASGQQWGRELAYTMDLSPDGFFLIVREQMQ
jgi:Holliday junction resolvase